MANVLVTGATGFVGKRLILNLLAQEHTVYALCRIALAKPFKNDHERLHYIWGDLKSKGALKNLPKEIDVAYYLVHSMSEIVNDLDSTEMLIAKQFLEGVQSTQIKQIIYLGGIINDEKSLSPHLRSRLLVEHTLQSGSIPVTILRASIIIGEGSASFEIIRDLCEKLPVMIAPKWVKSVCQPIAIDDVIFYLSAVLLSEPCYNQVFDIGGPEVLTFEEILYRYSSFRQLKTYIINVPVLTPHLSSYWLVFITSVRFSLCYYLVESMKTSTIVKHTGIDSLFSHRCLSYEEALSLAFQKITAHNIISTWMDSWELQQENFILAEFAKVPKEGCIKDERREKIQSSIQSTLAKVWSIGGDNGYYSCNWAWHLRGLMDKFIGGIGLNRGRRHPTEINVGDSIDFWRVLLADKSKGHLILFSEMKVPGEAWLEFEVQEHQGTHYLVQTATFRPRGIWGRLYWYILYPFHVVIFHNMARRLAG